MDSLAEVQGEVHQAFLASRRMEYLISSPKFTDIYYDSTPQEIKELAKILKEMDTVALEQWVDDHNSTDLEDLGIRALISRARKVRVPRYSSLTKIQLAKEIRKYEKIRDDKRDAQDALEHEAREQ